MVLLELEGGASPAIPPTRSLHDPPARPSIVVRQFPPLPPCTSYPCGWNDRQRLVGMWSGAESLPYPNMGHERPPLGRLGTDARPFPWAPPNGPETFPLRFQAVPILPATLRAGTIVALKLFCDNAEAVWPERVFQRIAPICSVSLPAES